MLYAWGVMGKALVVQQGWTKAQAALPFTVSTVAFALTMIFAGRCQDLIGPRWVAMLGGIILGVGLTVSSFARTAEVMMITFGIVGGIGIGLGYSATTPLSIKWFPPGRIGLITGIVVSGVGLAAVYMSPLTAHLIRTTSIPQTFVVLGIGTVILVSLLAQLLQDPPMDYSPASSASGEKKSGSQPRAEFDWQDMLATSQFYRLWLMFVLAASAGLMLIMHVAIIAKEQGHVDTWGFWLIAILALCNTAGRLLSGFISDRIGRTRTMVLAFLLQALNMFSFSHYTTPALLVFGSAFTGLCYGTIFTLFPATTADYYGVRNLGVNYGLMFTAFGVAGVTGPYVAGRIRDAFGAYNYAYTVSAIMLLGGILLALTLKAPKCPQVVAEPVDEPELAHTS